MPSTKLSADPMIKVIKVRDQRYTIQELTIGEYQDLEKKATTKRPNPVNEDAPMIDYLDQTVLLKFMVLKCVIEPKLTASTLSDLPMRIVLALNKTVNDMHFPDKDEAEDIVDVTDEDEEGEAKGEG
jgi:hypothetical protein